MTVSFLFRCNLYSRFRNLSIEQNKASAYNCTSHYSWIHHSYSLNLKYVPETYRSNVCYQPHNNALHPIHSYRLGKWALKMPNNLHQGRKGMHVNGALLASKIWIIACPHN